MLLITAVTGYEFFFLIVLSLVFSSTFKLMVKVNTKSIMSSADRVISSRVPSVFRGPKVGNHLSRAQCTVQHLNSITEAPSFPWFQHALRLGYNALYYILASAPPPRSLFFYPRKRLAVE